jgi:hypothetical protein
LCAFDDRHHVDIVIGNYRWRLKLAPGEPRYDDLERKLAARPPITVPTITMRQRFDGLNKDGAATTFRRGRRANSPTASRNSADSASA